jgi:hypothetical protein
MNRKAEILVEYSEIKEIYDGDRSTVARAQGSADIEMKRKKIEKGEKDKKYMKKMKKLP